MFQFSIFCVIFSFFEAGTMFNNHCCRCQASRILIFIDRSDDFELRQLSVEIIGLIANEGMMQRDLCIELGAVPATVELLKRFVFLY